MPLEFVNLEAIRRISALVIAEAGMGKTCLARTALGQVWRDGEWVQETPLPDWKILIVAAEPGLLSVMDLVQSGHIEAINIDSWQQMQECLQWLRADQEAQKKYKWIMPDSLTEICDHCEKRANEKFPDEAKAFKMWGEYSTSAMETIKGFRDLPFYSVIFTCLPTVDKDQDNRRFIGPDIAGKKIKQRLTSYFDEVLYLNNWQQEDGSFKRLFLTQPWDRMPAKDRSGKLDFFEHPNLLAIQQKILG